MNSQIIASSYNSSVIFLKNIRDFWPGLVDFQILDLTRHKEIEGRSGLDELEGDVAEESVALEPGVFVFTAAVEVGVVDAPLFGVAVLDKEADSNALADVKDIFVGGAVGGGFPFEAIAM